jgi:hypothetical protein
MVVVTSETVFFVLSPTGWKPVLHKEGLNTWLLRLNRNRLLQKVASPHRGDKRGAKEWRLVTQLSSRSEDSDGVYRTPSELDMGRGPKWKCLLRKPSACKIVDSYFGIVKRRIHRHRRH